MTLTNPGTTVRPDLDSWPALAAVPTGPRTAVSARIARALFRAAVGRLDVSVRLEHGAPGTPGATSETLGRGGPLAVVHRPDEFFARLGRDQLIGFGEAYLTGAWSEGTAEEGGGDLSGFLTVLAAEVADLVPRPLQRARAVVVKRPPRRQRSSSKNSRNNIAHYYDLSNDMFELFLDPTLSYSAALFEGDPALGTHADLPEAQRRKIDRLLDQAGVGAGTRLLEIGTGWGELAVRAAERGATVRTITLSTEQQDLARGRIAAAGHAAAVEVELRDYRTLLDDSAARGAFDAVVSVEMIEAVGWQYWRTYLETLDHVLAPGGKVAIQAITMPHDRMLATRNTYTWINKYIFPGGFLPSVRALDETSREHTSLRLDDVFSLGQHYTQTLRLWDQAFAAARHQVLALGFDDTFCRMWHFYLEYSRAGFASGYLDDHQLTFARPGEEARA